ncbi:MAG: periplasmic heavy metal sensor [Ignavibacteriales bacterium]|nr:periplasmic heavy metal sensor [Ignavibacteriales bacterium]
MKKIVLLLAAAMLFALPLSAQPQDRGTRGPRMEQRLKMLTDSLKLSDKQAEQIKIILQKSQEQMQKDREANQDDRDAMRAAMTKNTEHADKEIAKILTPDQKKKYEELQEQRRKQMQERMRNRE